MVFADMKLDDLLALLVNHPQIERIVFVVCDVHNVKMAAKLAKAVKLESGFEGKLEFARDFHSRETPLNHEEIFQVVNSFDQEEIIFLQEIPVCDETWIAFVIAPTFGSLEKFKNAGLCFLALGHNFGASSVTKNTNSCAKDYEAFSPAIFEQINNPVSMNNFGSYSKGEEGGPFTIQQIEELAKKFPIVKKLMTYGIKNVTYFLGKQVVKFAESTGNYDFNKPSKPADDAEADEKEIYAGALESYKSRKERAIKDHQSQITKKRDAFVPFLLEQVIPSYLKSLKGNEDKTDEEIQKMLPKVEGDKTINPTGSYLDRVLLNMTNGIGLECTDLQHILHIFFTDEKYFQKGTIVKNKKRGFAEFQAEENGKVLFPVDLKRARNDENINKLLE